MNAKRIARAIGVGLLISATVSQAVSWSDEDRANAVAREGDFLVVRTDGECAIKQSYHDNPGPMELVYKAGSSPTLITPYLSTPERVVYEVDPPQEIPANDMPASSMYSSTRMRLPESVIDEMKAGRQLKVMAKINGEWSRPHTISLMGFTAATSVLTSPQCQ